MSNRRVRSRESGVGSKGSGWVRDSSTNGDIIGRIVVMVFVACMIWNFGSIVAYGADALRGMANAEPRTVSPSSPFEGIKKTYAEIRSLETRFTQRILISSLKKDRESTGEFFFKRQKGFLWRYMSPKVQYFLFDGNYLWQADNDKPFVIKDKINKEKIDGTFFDLIEDIAKIDELFTLKEQRVEGDLEVMELVPKKEGTVNSAKVWIDKRKMVKKIELLEFTGNINTIEFSAVKVNRPLDDNKFVFKRESGKEIVER